MSGIALVLRTQKHLPYDSVTAVIGRRQHPNIMLSSIFSTMRLEDEEKGSIMFGQINVVGSSASSSSDSSPCLLQHDGLLMRNSNTLSRKQEQSKTQHRFFSDNLLGHSPMAQPVPRKSEAVSKPLNPGQSGPSWGVDANTKGGGIWAQTSAKRTKLAELKGELKEGQTNLADAATNLQRLDLYLADGLALVAQSADDAWPTQQSLRQKQDKQAEEITNNHSVESSNNDNNSDILSLSMLPQELADFCSWLSETEKEEDDELNKLKFDAHLNEASRRLDSTLSILLHEKPNTTVYNNKNKSSLPLNEIAMASFARIRDFVPNDTNNDDKEFTSFREALTDTDLDAINTERAFDLCCLVYRLILTKSAIVNLKQNWKHWTTLTDADVDRAAVLAKQQQLSTTTANKKLSRTKLNQVLQSYIYGSCIDRLQATWSFLDHDDDGRLDQVEMDRVVESTIRPVGTALQDLIGLAFEAHPVRSILPMMDLMDINSVTPSPQTTTTTTTQGKWWWSRWSNRRLERRTKRQLTRLLKKSIRHHFDLDVELPHRLRCIYAWAEKEHQNNSIDTVLLDVDNDDKNTSSSSISFLGGSKRHVELHPKIALNEFKVIQKEQLPQLERIGQEFVISGFRDDLLMTQGQKRQNTELRRDCALFFVVVCLFDVGIYLL